MIIVMQHPADAGHVDHVTRTLHDMNLRALADAIGRSLAPALPAAGCHQAAG